MFTGLIESLSAVRRVESLDDGVELTISADLANELAIGESIAVNGACLTVVAKDADSFRVQAGFETLARTNLGELHDGDRVNLERALRFGDRLGGHLVTGHVDCLGSIRSRERRGEFELISFACPPEWTRQMVPKGSITVDGISLTLVDATNDGFSVMLIPHTLGVTTLGFKKPGDSINLETDLLAKYVQKQLARLAPP
jgi:riboflavin synthase